MRTGGEESRNRREGMVERERRTGYLTEEDETEMFPLLFERL